MDARDTIAQWEANGKWIYAGTLVHEGIHDEYVHPRTHTVHLRHREQIYHVHIGLSMLSAPGGEFDSDDTVFADIYSVDGERLGPIAGVRDPAVEPDFTKNFMRRGYVCRHHFGDYGDEGNQGPSCYLGRINEDIALRLFIQGDDWAAASYSVVEL